MTQTAGLAQDHHLVANPQANHTCVTGSWSVYSSEDKVMLYFLLMEFKELSLYNIKRYVHYQELLESGCLMHPVSSEK